MSGTEAWVRSENHKGCQLADGIAMLYQRETREPLKEAFATEMSRQAFLRRLGEVVGSRE